MGKIYSVTYQKWKFMEKYNYTELVSDLLEIAPTKRLKKSLLTLFVSFVQSDEAYLNEDYKEIAADFYFLIQFLERLEE